MTTPDWVDRAVYPFRSRYVETSHGSMHYVDEGEGPEVLMVHGTPTWSFLFRHLIRDLARDHRVVAPDHLGFGLSDKPEDAPYRPKDHAERLSPVSCTGITSARSRTRPDGRRRGSSPGSSTARATGSTSCGIVGIGSRTNRHTFSGERRIGCSSTPFSHAGRKLFPGPA